MFRRKGVALTTVCATAIPLVPFTIFANDQTDQGRTVHVVEQAEGQDIDATAEAKESSDQDLLPVG